MVAMLSMRVMMCFVGAMGMVMGRSMLMGMGLARSGIALQEERQTEGGDDEPGDRSKPGVEAFRDHIA